jgi:hypothetical protein
MSDVSSENSWGQYGREKEQEWKHSAPNTFPFTDPVEVPLIF